jgi:fatty-acyl-CoA synthase
MRTESFILQEKTLGGLLDETAARFPGNDALIYPEKGVRETWAELGHNTEELARGLIALGARQGDRIALWAANVPHWITLMFACARIGAVLVAVNANCRTRELGYLLRQSGCRMLFMAAAHRDHDLAGIVESVVPEISEQPSGNLRVAGLPHLRRVFLMGKERKRGILCLDDVFALSRTVSEAEYAAAKAKVRPRDVVNMQYTSGTTGFPKGVMLTHVNIVNNGYWVGRRQDLSSADRVCLPVPLFHCIDCVLGVMALVNHGAGMAILESFNPRQVLRAVEKERCTSLYGVPSMFQAILEYKHFSRYDLSSLRTGVMAGAVCPAALVRRVATAMHMPRLTVCYGLTEASPVMTQTHALDDFERKTTTVGKALPGISVLVADPAALPKKVVEMPRGTPGEVICKGYNVMQGYYNLPEETAEAITPESWLRSGDLGVMDEEGYLAITGRIKDMIIRGGENIYPREIEDFLSGMEEVRAIQVVGVPGGKYGEEVAAFIIPREGATLTPGAVRAYCRGKIAWYKVPRHIAFVTEYPMTGSGKIRKGELREQAAGIFSRPPYGRGDVSVKLVKSIG